LESSSLCNNSRKVTTRPWRARGEDGSTMCLFGLIVSIDKMGIHYVPISRIRIWEENNSKFVKVYYVEDKRQITMATSSATDGHVLFF
jgi:hypothetical protein